MTPTTYIQNQPPSAWDQVREIMDSASGVYRTQKLASDVFSLIAEGAKFAGRTWDKFQSAAAVLSNGALGIIVPCTVSSTIDFGQSAFALAKKGMTFSYREGVELLQKGSLSLQMIAYSGLLFTKRSICGVAGDMLSVIEDGSDVFLENDSLQALPAEQTAAISTEAKIYLAETKKLHWIRLAKAIMAVAGGVLGLMGLMSQSLAVPATILLGMSVITSVLALAGRVYKTNMTYILPNA